ncbi:MAG: hypothetical protein KDD64_03065 [Bdellovibrionales bacterium]|nr:hypothetical protein [Bdellovibrionales bacterium]
MNRNLLIVLLSLGLGMLITEQTLGVFLHKREVERYRGRNISEPLTLYRAPTNTFPVPPKTKRRIIYLSNSHARTGGFVSHHLQRLLDGVEPDKWQVLDFSDPGIFAPDMLQRGIFALEWEPDLFIFPVAYISFSDRMQLRRQAHTARSFFRPEVFSHLPFGFWMRNYDIGLYLDELMSSALYLHRYRSDLRNLWEKPLAALLHSSLGPEQIHSLEVQQSISWKFPDGFDRNLFDWRLYAEGRSGHLADYNALVSLYHKHKIPTVVANLPVHWEKDPHQHREGDVQLFRQQLKTFLPSEVEFIDYQGTFPKEFSTYDALHPTWHGARLHALDIVLRMISRGLLSVKPDTVLKEFSTEGEQDRDQYRTIFSLPSEEKTERFLRYDLFDAKNARHLLDALDTLKIGSPSLNQYVAKLVSRIRFWRTNQADCGSLWTGSPWEETWLKGCSGEISRAALDLDVFVEALNSSLGARLKPFPISQYLAETAPIEEKVFPIQSERGNFSFSERQYSSDTARIFVYTKSSDSHPFAIAVRPSAGPSYLRIDLLGDGGFAILTDPRNFSLPWWVTDEPLKIDWGIQ